MISAIHIVVDFNLIVHCLNTFIDDFITWTLEVGRSLVVALDHGVNCASREVWTHAELEEIKSHKVVEV